MPEKPNLLAYWPIIMVAGGLVATGAVAQFQINANSADIAGLHTSLETRVPTFLYDIQRQGVERDLDDFSDSVDQIEADITDLQRNDDAAAAALQLEIQKLRTELERASSAQAAQLRAILELLERQLEDQRKRATKA